VSHPHSYPNCTKVGYWKKFAALVVVFVVFVVVLVKGRFPNKLLDYECGKICEMHSASKVSGSFDRMIY
jgi:hypothetical protein